MNSPIYPDTPMQMREIEPGLTVYECPKSGGLWLTLQAYLAWREQQPESPATPAGNSTPILPEEPNHRALICPESGRLLLRYPVGHGLPFHIDRSPATGSVWLDKGEWEALKSKGLHVSLHLIFTAAYQRQIRTVEYTQKLSETFRDRIGAEDFVKVKEFADWLARHPKGRDICCYLLDNLEQKSGP
jgi:Zn-finger nucleic acid-binding protein